MTQPLKIVLILGVLVLASSCAKSPPVTDAQPTSPQPSSKSTAPIDAHGRVEQNKQHKGKLRFAEDLLKADATWLINQLKTIHPAPFSRVDEQEFVAQFELLKHSLNGSLTLDEFYLKLAPILAKLNDVHTYIEYPKLTPSSQLPNLTSRLPLAVIIENDKVFIAADLSSSAGLRPGTEIIAINDTPVTAILKKMRAIVARETNPGQARKIQLDFARLLPVIGISSQTYRLQFKYKDAIWQAELAGLPWLKTKDSNEDSDNALGSLYGFSKVASRTGLLWLNDFSEQPEVFAEFIQKTFYQMAEQGINNLIIDVRYNQGGLTENLKYLLGAMAQKPVNWAHEGEIKVSETLKKHHRHTTRKRREHKSVKGLKWLPIEWTNWLQYAIWWSDTSESISLEFDPIEPIALPKQQRVWVLTNGFCFSACASFVAAVNYYKLGVTVGEQVGSLVNQQFGYPVTVTLPHSKLKVKIPSMQIFFKTEQLVDLTLPQIAVHRSYEDIQARRDPVLGFALNQAKQSP